MANSDLHGEFVNAQKFADEIGKTIKARVTVIAVEGKVFGDSEVGAARLDTLENHKNRPEVRSAMASGKGTSIRHSATLNIDMLYTAMPFGDKAKPDGIIRLAIPLTIVKDAKSALNTTLGLTFLVAFLSSILFSYLLSELTSRPLRQIAAIAREIGDGDFSKRFPAEWHDEVGDLANVMNDMTSRLEKSVKRLKKERDRLDVILNSMNEGLLVTNSSGEISIINPAFCKLFGLDLTVKGKSLTDVCRDPRLLDAYREVIDKGRELQNEIDVIGESTNTVRISWVPLYSGGVVAVFHDVTDMKRIEEIRKDFVANVSHELRTPVAVIKGYAEALHSGIINDNPEKADQFAKTIDKHAERLTELISDLLNLSELESSKFSLKISRVDLTEIVQNVLVLLESKAALKGIHLSVVKDRDQAFVMADESKIGQVLFNLVSNAIKYSSSGDSVTITLDSEGNDVRVAVVDTGQGIPSDSIPRLFERFYRVDKGRARDEGGTGLGLAIVKHIVQLHGSVVKVKSIEGEGSTFSFTLKRAV